MKKEFAFFVLGLLLVTLSISLVSANTVESAKKFTNSAYEVVKPVLEVMVGPATDTEIFLAKVLFLIIIFSIVWVVIDKIEFFSGNTWVLWGVSIAVSILAVRWFGGTEVVKTAILSYSAFGVAITCGLPFVLFFFVVKDFNKTARKLSWIFFAVVFVGLWIMRAGAVDAKVMGSGVGSFAYIYLITAGLAVLMLLLDKTIQRTLKQIQAENKMSYQDLLRKNRLLEDLDKARDARIKATTKAEIHLVEAKIKSIEDAIAALP